MKYEDELFNKIPPNFTDQENQYQTWILKEMRKSLFEKMDSFLLNTPQGGISDQAIDAAKEPEYHLPLSSCLICTRPSPYLRKEK